jgi:hypothetical protein
MRGHGSKVSIAKIIEHTQVSTIRVFTIKKLIRDGIMDR